jgi:hypothetical protein
MTTPSGPLVWGQAGNYNAVNDRLVIRGLSYGAFGLIQAPTLGAGSGLVVNIGPWIACVDCGDGTSAIIGATAPATINETAGGASQRVDALWADINPDGTSQYGLSWLPSPVSGRTGVLLGTATVPASAATASAMTFAPAGLLARGIVQASYLTADAAQCSSTSISATGLIVNITPGTWVWEGDIYVSAQSTNSMIFSMTTPANSAMGSWTSYDQVVNNPGYPSTLLKHQAGSGITSGMSSNALVNGQGYTAHVRGWGVFTAAGLLQVGQASTAAAASFTVKVSSQLRAWQIA